MEVKKIVNKLESTDEFLDWSTKNPESYLVHIFKMFDKANFNEYQIGYYDPATKKITTFVINDKEDSISINPESEAFREEETHIEKLDLDEIKISFNEAMRKVQVLLEKEHSAHPADKSFTILQRLLIGVVWNFTFITKTFHVINIKVDATNGEVVENKLNSVFEFKSGQ